MCVNDDERYYVAAAKVRAFLDLRTEPTKGSDQTIRRTDKSDIEYTSDKSDISDAGPDKSDIVLKWLEIAELDPKP